MPAFSFSNSPDSCGVVPIPGLAYVIAVGSALQRVTRSAIDLIPEVGLATNRLGEVPSSLIGAKSAKAS